MVIRRTSPAVSITGGAVSVTGGVLAEGGASLDAFGRLRVSENHLLLSSQLTYDLLPLVWDTILTGGGTVVHNPNTSSAEMTVTTSSGDKVVRQTKRYWLYRPGQAQSVSMTFASGDLVTNTRKRAGYFDDNDGVFLEITGTEVAIVLRSSTSGSPVEERVTQANWNLDTMDGSGASSINLDWTKSQILVIDLQWLGVGDVRIGLDVEETTTYVHNFSNANTKDTVYMRSASLPVRYEIENTGVSAGAQFDQICTSVVREGGFEEEGFATAYSTSLQTPQAATTTPQTVLAIQLRPSHVHAFIRPVAVQITNLTNSVMRWHAVLNPTVSGSYTWANHGQAGQVSTSQLDYIAGTGHTVAAGAVVSQGNTKATFDAGLAAESTLGVSATSAGVSDVLAVVVEADAAPPQDLIATITYMELF